MCFGNLKWFKVMPRRRCCVDVTFAAFQATQSNNADRYATSLLRVSVQAANENAPKFVRKHQVTSLLENAPIGSYVTTVSAIDNDEVSASNTRPCKHDRHAGIFGSR